MTLTHRPSRWLLGLLLPALLLSACSDDGGGGGDGPEDVLAEAKQELDDTSGVQLHLKTAELPEGIDGILEATGVGTHAPAFEGDLTVLVNNLTVEVPVVAVDGEVSAKLPFTTKFEVIEPADYGAPDPATLMDPSEGISAWLTAAEGVEEGDEVREGERVLTSYAGTLPGDAVAAVIPSSDEKADFEVTFRVDDEGRLDTAVVSGPFYGSKGEVEYTVTISDYGTEKDITKP